MRDGAGNPGCFLGVNIYFHNIAILFMFCYTKYEYLVCERRIHKIGIGYKITYGS